jgi:MFS family permease
MSSEGSHVAAEGRHHPNASWLPLVIIVLAQLQMGINVTVLPVSLGPISEDLHAPPTATATALLVYSLFVAAFVMLGAKIGKLVGERRTFQIAVVVHGVAMAVMATSSDVATMNTAQALAGVAAIALLAVFPAARLPRYVPDELSAEDIVDEDESRSG